MTNKPTAPCIGCRDNYYNGYGAQECWLLAKAKLVKRWRIQWWAAPTEPGALTQVETYNCHHAPGKYALYETLPNCAVDPTYLKKQRVRA